MKSITLNRHVVFTGLSAAMCLGVLAGCSPQAVDAAAADAGQPIVVATARVGIADVATIMEAGGLIQATTTAAISARILAPVREVRVAAGDRVRQGQTLIVLSAADLSAGARVARSAAAAADQGAKAAAADLNAAEAGLVLARVSHERIAGLHARRSATAQELDEATAVLRGAEARLSGASARVMQAASEVESARAASDAARATESFTAITAPFDGVITEKLVEPGNMASPGTALLRVEDTRRFRLEVRVDESRVDRIRSGDRVPIALGAEPAIVEGAVDEVSRAVDADARAFLVKIILPDVHGLRSGQFGKARFHGETRRALTVPASAIIRRGQLTSVFVIDGDRARVRLISLNGSEVTAGLSESELVILAPPPDLIDGHRVIDGGR
jgi:multidrug efflux pump subunit AcrA (membrane-fusion protein)